MKIDILKVADLIPFVDSEKFKNSSEIPITRLRAISHAKNPRAMGEDLALLVAKDESENLLAYLGFLPDTLFENDIPEKIWWVSCWWASEKIKSNAAIQLFYYAMKELNGKIYLPELTVETKFLLEKLKLFEVLSFHTGIRGYLRSNLTSILPVKIPALKKWEPLLQIADKSFNVLTFPIWFYWKSRYRKLNFSYAIENRIDDDAAVYIDSKNKKEIFRRSEKELNWIIENPWLTSSKSDIKQDYAFTCFVKHYAMPVVKIFEKEKIVGLFVLLMHNGKAILTHSYFEPNSSGKVVDAIYKLILDHNIHTFTTFDEDLVAQIQKGSNPFLFTKRQKKYFAFPRNKRDVILNGKLQHGDGDCAFV